jgi:hypothetical protein
MQSTSLASIKFYMVTIMPKRQDVDTALYAVSLLQLKRVMGYYTNFGAQGDLIVMHKQCTQTRFETRVLLNQNKCMQSPFCSCRLAPLLATLLLNTANIIQNSVAGYNHIPSCLLAVLAGMAFTIVSILTGLTGLYTLGFTYGGPVVITWGWLISVLFTCTVAAR